MAEVDTSTLPGRAAVNDFTQSPEKEIGGHPQRLFHLAVPPAAFGPVAGIPGTSGLALLFSADQYRAATDAFLEGIQRQVR